MFVGMIFFLVNCMEIVVFDLSEVVNVSVDCVMDVGEVSIVGEVIIVVLLCSVSG